MNTDQETKAPLGLRYGEVTDKILGIFYKVYNELGHGFLEFPSDGDGYAGSLLAI